MSGLELLDMGLSRRGFLKWCGYLASTLALPAGLTPRIAAGLERKPRLPVIWLSFQSCSGCTESLTRSHKPTLEHLIFDYVSLDFHDVLQAAAGATAEQTCEQSIKANFGKYLLIVEGSIPIRAKGAYATCAGMSNLAQLRDAADGAAAIIAVGSCAAFGGIPKADPNPTGAQSVTKLMASGRIPDRPLANIPGCPPLPIAMSATLAHVVVFGEFPKLDALQRPVSFFGKTIHERCSRLSFFQQGRFAERFDDEGARQGWCLYKLGCKGPATYQSVVYNGRSFYAIAPFFSHTVMEKAHECGYCHNNKVLQEYDETGKITVTKWDEEKKKPVVATGMIPIPPDWQRALQFDFADFTGDPSKPGQKDKWVFLKQGADLTQLYPDFAYPLTDSQLTKLRVPVEELPIAKKHALMRMGIRLPAAEQASPPAQPPTETPRVSPLKELSHD